MLVLCAVLSHMAVAQSGRFVNGVVFDENDSPMVGVKVVAKGGTEQFVTGPDGQFKMTVSAYTKYLEAYAEGYLTQSAEIDGSYIVFRMKIDKKYAEQKAAEEKAAAEAAAAKAKAEEEARIAAQKAAEAKRVAEEKAAASKAKAEEQARIEAEKKAEAERIAAQKAAEAKRIAEEKAAAAKAKAEEEARIAAEKKAEAERLAAQKAAEAKRIAEEKAAAAKARAEEQARIEAEKKAEAERIAAQKAAEAKRIAEEKAAAAKAKAEEQAKKIAKRKEIDKAYNAKYRNKGLVHSFELSYGYQSGKENVIYKNLGYREYGSLHPVEATYTIGYRFCNWVSVGVGAGVSYNVVNLCTYGDVFDPMYKGTDKFTPINIPVFLNTKVYMSRGKYQPILSVSGGVYAPNLELLADVGVGCNLRLSKRGNMYFLASIRTTPYGFFVENSSSDGYYFSDFVWTPSFKIGFTF